MPILTPAQMAYLCEPGFVEIAVATAKINIHGSGMLPYLLGITGVGSVRPYVRKHILNTLEPQDYMFINSLVISVFILGFFVYTYIFNTVAIQRTYKNCCNMSYSQMGAVILLGLFTVISSFVLFNIEKNFNTPAINHVLLKAFSLVALFAVGLFIFNEAYTVNHFLGVGVTITGIAILLANPL